MSATIKDVARLAGVSISTASIALSGKGPVSAETRERVLAAAEKLRYRPNALARSLVTSHSHSVGLILPDLRDPYFHEIASGVERVAWEAGYTLLLADTNRSPSKERAVVEAFRSHRVDGMIFAGSGREGELGPLLDPADTAPIVVLGRPHAPQPYVRVDNVAAGRIATEHLLRLGRNRLSFVGGPADLTTSIDRAAGFQEAMRAAGRALDFTYVTEADFTPDGARRAVLALLDRLEAEGKEFPDGVVAANDQMAIGVLQALRARGIPVPENEAVVGIGDIPTATYVETTLTTVALPTREMGEAAMDVLLRLMRGEKPPEEPVTLPVQLVRRGSA